MMVMVVLRLRLIFVVGDDGDDDHDDDGCNGCWQQLFGRKGSNIGFLMSMYLATVCLISVAVSMLFVYGFC